MIKTLSLLLAAGLTLTALGAMAQEYTATDASTTEYSTNEFHDQITTYTSYSFAEYDGRMKETAFVYVTTSYGLRYNSLYQDITPADSTVSYYKDLGWKGPATNSRHAQAPPIPQSEPRAQSPITVTTGPIVAPVVQEAVVVQDDGATYNTNIKSGKWHAFKNGE
jgi:hypothetical protein